MMCEHRLLAVVQGEKKSSEYGYDGFISRENTGLDEKFEFSGSQAAMLAVQSPSPFP